MSELFSDEASLGLRRLRWESALLLWREEAQETEGDEDGELFGLVQFRMSQNCQYAGI